MMSLSVGTFSFLNGNSTNPLIPPTLYPKSVLEIGAHVVLQLTICVLGLGFAPAYSIWRPALLPVLTISLYLNGQVCVDIMPRLILSNMVGGFTCAWWTQYIVSGLILQENFEDSGPLRKGKNRGLSKGENDSFSKRVMFGLNTINSQRNIGTPQETKYVPPFSFKDPTHIPSRSQFLANRAWLICFSYLVIDLLTSQEKDISHNSTDFSQDRAAFFSRIHDITVSEFQTRVMISVGQYVAIYFLLTLVHSVLAFTTVLFGFYEPVGWPPIFGSVWELYSMRNFWGRFWHSMMRYKLEGTSNFIVFDILNLPRRTLITRYVKLFCVFFISGLCHVLMDIWGPIPLRECRALQYFMYHVFIFMFEDAVQGAYRASFGVKRTNAEPRLWIKLIGFVWVVGVMIWVTPMWVFPGLRHALSGDKAQLLPFSVVKLILP